MIQPLENRILIEPIENQDKNPNGKLWAPRPSTIYAYDLANKQDVAKQFCQGKVLAVGPGKRHPKTGKRRPVEVEVGEYIIFSDSCSRPCGDGRFMVREDDIISKSKEPYEHAASFTMTGATHPFMHGDNHASELQ